MTTRDYEEVLAHRRVARAHQYDVDRVQLYGLGVGLGLDPLDRRQLRFLADVSPAVMPTFATVAAWDVGFQLELGVEWSKLLHASQSVTLPGPLPPTADVLADTVIEAVFDKPARNATLLVVRTTLRNADTDAELATLRSVSLARDFRVAGAPSGAPPRCSAPPERAPDLTVQLATSPQVALIYRMLGGRSLIHFDPDDARAQGFDRPIMHGLSTFGHACHALLRAACNYDPARVREFSAEFSAPAHPGDVLETQFWFDANNIRFVTRALERDIVVLANGYAQVDEARG